jgi:hypothetical protein
MTIALVSVLFSQLRVFFSPSDMILVPFDEIIKQGMVGSASSMKLSGIHIPIV